MNEINPRLLRMAIAAGAGAAATANTALSTANTAQTTANTASSTATSANTLATQVNERKEQFTDRLIANPGYIILQPSGLVLEWGFSSIAGGAGVATITYQKLTQGRFPYTVVCIYSTGKGAGVGTTVNIQDLTITGGAVVHHINCRLQTAGVTSNGPNGDTIQWLAVGY